MKYQHKKRLNKFLDKAPVYLCMPLYPFAYTYLKIKKRVHKQYLSKKKYSHKTILKLIKFCIDYHLDYNITYKDKNYIYIVDIDYISRYSYQDDEVYDCYGYSNIFKTNYKHKKVEKKLSRIYINQREDYVKALHEICQGKELSDEEKEDEFTIATRRGNTYVSEAYNKVKDYNVYKITIDKNK